MSLLAGARPRGPAPWAPAMDTSAADTIDLQVLGLLEVLSVAAVVKLASR